MFEERLLGGGDSRVDPVGDFSGGAFGGQGLRGGAAVTSAWLLSPREAGGKLSEWLENRFDWEMSLDREDWPFSTVRCGVILTTVGDTECP